MITITLGTTPFPFNRLIDWLATLLKERVIVESVFLQYGATDVSPVVNHPLVIASSLVRLNQLFEYIDTSRLVISHAGDGSTRELVVRKQSFVLIPRLARYGEHVDDHQLMFAESMRSLGICYCQSIDDLKDWIMNPPPPVNPSVLNKPKLADYLLHTYPPKY